MIIPFSNSISPMETPLPVCPFRQGCFPFCGRFAAHFSSPPREEKAPPNGTAAARRKRSHRRRQKQPSRSGRAAFLEIMPGAQSVTVTVAVVPEARTASACMASVVTVCSGRLPSADQSSAPETPRSVSSVSPVKPSRPDVLSSSQRMSVSDVIARSPVQSCGRNRPAGRSPQA